MYVQCVETSYLNADESSAPPTAMCNEFIPQGPCYSKFLALERELDHVTTCQINSLTKFNY